MNKLNSTSKSVMISRSSWSEHLNGITRQLTDVGDMRRQVLNFVRTCPGPQPAASTHQAATPCAYHPPMWSGTPAPYYAVPPAASPGIAQGPLAPQLRTPVVAPAAMPELAPAGKRPNGAQCPPPAPAPAPAPRPTVTAGGCATEAEDAAPLGA